MVFSFLKLKGNECMGDFPPFCTREITCDFLFDFLPTKHFLIQSVNTKQKTV